jgi:5'-nucleotidase
VRFLVTNDDGIHAEGLMVLVEALSELGEVCIVAPNQERSGVSHAITVNRPLRIEKFSVFPRIGESYVMDGTPADCVKLAIESMNLEVDYVVSGINNGANLGIDVFYSGTVAAAFEGALQKIPSIAVSLCKNPLDAHTYYQTAASSLCKLLSNTEWTTVSALLNINVPNVPIELIRGFKAAKLGVNRYKNEFEKRLDPRGKPYYWMKGVQFHVDSTEGDDFSAIEQNYISVTPLLTDLTNYQILHTLRSLFV